MKRLARRLLRSSVRLSSESKSTRRFTRLTNAFSKKDGLEIEIVGEIATMIELGIGPNKKQANLDERMARSVKVVAGARNQRYLHLDHTIL